MRIVEVEWVDAMQLDMGGWIDVEDLEDGCMENGGMRHLAVGYLVKESEAAIAIAQAKNAALSDENNCDTRLSAVQIIPRPAVLSMRIIDE